MKRCPICGREFVDDSLFCEYDGGKLIEYNDQPYSQQEYNTGVSGVQQAEPQPYIQQDEYTNQMQEQINTQTTDDIQEYAKQAFIPQDGYVNQTHDQSYANDSLSQESNMTLYAQEPAQQAAEPETYVQEPAQQVAEMETYVQEPAQQVAEMETYVQEPVQQAAEMETYAQEPAQQVAEMETYVQEPVQQAAEMEAYAQEPAQQAAVMNTYVQESAQQISQTHDYNQSQNISDNKIFEQQSFVQDRFSQQGSISNTINTQRYNAAQTDMAQGSINANMSYSQQQNMIQANNIQIKSFSTHSDATVMTVFEKAAIGILIGVIAIAAILGVLCIIGVIN